MCTARKHGRGNIWLQCPLQPSWISEQSEIILNFILCNHFKSRKTKTFFATILNLLTKTQNYLKLSQLLSWIPQKLWHSEIIVLHHPTSPDPTKTLNIWNYLGHHPESLKTIWNHHNFDFSPLDQVLPEVLRWCHDWPEKTKQMSSSLNILPLIVGGWTRSEKTRHVTLQQSLSISLGFKNRNK